MCDNYAWSRMEATVNELKWQIGVQLESCRMSMGKLASATAYGEQKLESRQRMECDGHLAAHHARDCQGSTAVRLAWDELPTLSCRGGHRFSDPG